MTKIETLSLAIIFAIGLASCNQSSQQKSQTTEAETVKNTVPLDFIKTFEGQLNNKLDVVVKLTSNNGNITGKYFYKSVGQDIELKGTVDNQGKVKLSEFDSKGNQTGVFEGEMPNENKIEGTWSKPNGSSIIPFVLLVSNSSYDESQKLFKQKKEEEKNWTGTYTTMAMTLHVQGPEIDGGVRFKLTQTTSNCGGIIEGIAYLTKSWLATYYDENSKCRVTFTYNPGSIQVNESNCGDYYGTNCGSFNGWYYKK